jgi:hypothetical protein
MELRWKIIDLPRESERLQHDRIRVHMPLLFWTPVHQTIKTDNLSHQVNKEEELSLVCV